MEISINDVEKNLITMYLNEGKTYSEVVKVLHSIGIKSTTISKVTRVDRNQRIVAMRRKNMEYADIQRELINLGFQKMSAKGIREVVLKESPKNLKIKHSVHTSTANVTDEMIIRNKLIVKLRREKRTFDDIRQYLIDYGYGEISRQRIHQIFDKYKNAV